MTERTVRGAPKGKPLGDTGIRITPVGLGTWAMGGGGWEFAWGSQDDDRSRAAIHRAVELGMNWLDTAPAYGTGHSEELVGRALKEIPRPPHVFTKVSLRWTPERKIVHNLKARSIAAEVEESRRRLGVEVLDLVQVHWPTPDEDIEEGWRALVSLKDRGLVRHIGVSNFDVPQMERAAGIAPVETLQPPYSLVSPEVEQEVLPYARAHRIGVIVYSPMGSGLLTGAMSVDRVAKLPEDDWRRRDSEFKEPRLSRHLALARLLSEIGRDRGGRTTAEVAIAWTLANPAVTGAIVGARSAEQVDGFAGALSFRLDKNDLERIEEFRLSHP